PHASVRRHRVGVELTPDKDATGPIHIQQMIEHDAVGQCLVDRADFRRDAKHTGHTLAIPGRGFLEPNKLSLGALPRYRAHASCPLPYRLRSGATRLQPGAVRSDWARFRLGMHMPTTLA